MTFVLDASVALTWCFVDEVSDYADAVLELLATDEAVVPPIWPLEVANVLLVAEKAGRLDESRVTAALEFLADLPIQVEALGLSGLGNVVDVARRLRLTANDASYLRIAMRLGRPLATLDTKLRGAAEAVGVEIALR